MPIMTSRRKVIFTISAALLVIVSCAETPQIEMKPQGKLKQQFKLGLDRTFIGLRFTAKWRCPMGEFMLKGNWIQARRSVPGRIASENHSVREEFERVVGRRGRTWVVAIKNGWLEATASGEYGGGVEFIDRNRKSERIGGLAQLPVTHLIPLGNTVIAIQSLQHLSLRWGAVAVLYEQEPGRWKTRREWRTPGAPTLVRIASDRVFFVTYVSDRSAMRFHGEHTMGTLIGPETAVEAFVLSDDGSLSQLACR